MARIKNMKTIDLKIAENEEKLWVTYIGNLTTNLANYNRIIGENEV